MTFNELKKFLSHITEKEGNQIVRINLGDEEVEIVPCISYGDKLSFIVVFDQEGDDGIEMDASQTD